MVSAIDAAKALHDVTFPDSSLSVFIYNDSYNSATLDHKDGSCSKGRAPTPAAAIVVAILKAEAAKRQST